MYQQNESELSAVFRDTSGHRLSVRLQFLAAFVTFAALTLFQIATDFRWIAFSLLGYLLPFHLVLAALRDMVSHSKAEARHLDGYDTPAPIKSTRKMTFLVFGGAILIVSLMMWSSDPMRDAPAGSNIIGLLIFVGLMSYKFYLAVFRPDKQPNLAPKRSEALSATWRTIGAFGRQTLSSGLGLVAMIVLYMLFFYLWPSTQPAETLYY